MQMNDRYPSLGKLSIAILENYVKPIIGDAAIKEIKSPVEEKEINNKIVEALQITEKRFIEESSDKELCDLLLALPLANLPVVEENAQSFYEKPNASSFSDFLTKRMLLDFPFLTPDRIDKGVNIYVDVFRQEISNISNTVRQKIMALSMLNTEKNVTHIARTLDNFLDYIISQPYSSHDGDNNGGNNLELTRKDMDSSDWSFKSSSRIISIGRSPDNDVTIEDLKISWHHGYIEKITNRYIYHHLSNTNSTVIYRPNEKFLLTNKRLTNLAILNEDRIVIGDIIFVVRFDIKAGTKGYVTTERNEK